MRGQNDAFHRSEAHAIAVALAVAGDGHFVAIFEEFARDAVAAVDWFRALPAQLEHGAKRIGRLKKRTTNV